MAPNNLDLTQIAPHLSTKYSPNLHKFLSSRRHRTIAAYGQVYRDRDGTLYLGYLDENCLIGARLMTILCSGRRTETWCFSNLGPLDEVPDFWRRYIEDGRCAIDIDHTISFIGGQTRWTTGGEHRECVWCGKVTQRRETWIEPVARERWITQKCA